LFEISFYVNDLIITRKDSAIIFNFRAYLGSCFSD